MKVALLTEGAEGILPQLPAGKAEINVFIVFPMAGEFPDVKELDAFDGVIIHLSENPEKDDAACFFGGLVSDRGKHCGIVHIGTDLKRHWQIREARRAMCSEKTSLTICRPELAGQYLDSLITDWQGK